MASDRNTRTFRVKDTAYEKALKRRCKKPLRTILEEVVIYRSKGFSIVAKRNKETIEIAN